MTSNEINWLLFSLFVLAALVQASAALVRLWTACDNRHAREKVVGQMPDCFSNNLNSSDYRVLA